MQHSIYGASSAERWLNCPGSVKLSQQAPPEKESAFAQEGTDAHNLAESILVGKTIADHLIDEEMASYVQIYTDYVQNKAKRGDLYVETKLELKNIHPDMFGTVDAFVYSESLGVLEIIDFKYGEGIEVYPYENKQLLFYALGAAQLLKVPKDTEVKLTVVQPRGQGEPIRSWYTTMTRLNTYRIRLKEGIEKCESDVLHLKDGSWCRFCPAQATCPELYKKALEVSQVAFKKDKIILPEVESIGKKDIAKVLAFAPTMQKWLKAVEAHAHYLLESGCKIDGYKLVKKRAGNRIWKEETIDWDSVCKEANIAKDDIYTVPKLKSPAQIEKLIGKDLVAPLVERPDSGTTVAPLKDRRAMVESSPLTVFSTVKE